MYKQHLALNKPQGLTCHKTQPNQWLIYQKPQPFMQFILRRRLGYKSYYNE